jgi:hypothetical protein
MKRFEYLRNLVGHMAAVLDKLESDKRAVMEDRQYSSEYKTRQMNQLTDAARVEATASAILIFGEAKGGRPLEGGEFWAAYEGAKARLQAATDATWAALDPAAIALAGPLMVARVSRADSVEQAAIILRDGPRVVRRAAALDTTDILGQRFAQDGRMLQNRLRAELDAELDGAPDVVAAQAELAELDQIGIDAMHAIERARGALVGADPMGFRTDPLSAILQQVERPTHGAWTGSMAAPTGAGDWRR